MRARVVLLSGTPADGDVTVTFVQRVAEGGDSWDEFVALYDAARVTLRVAEERVLAAVEGDVEVVQLRQLRAWRLIPEAQ